MKVIIGQYEGTIYPEGDGYTGAIALGLGPDGKRRRLKRKGRTKAQVKTKLSDAVTDLENEVKSQRDYTVKKAMNDFLDRLARQGKSDSTMKTYRRLVETHIVAKIGHVKLKELTADQVEKWLNTCAEGMTTVTVGILHMLLRQAIRQAARRDKVGRNVALLVDTPQGKKASRRSKSFTLDEATTLLQTAQDPKQRIGAYVMLAIVSGLRTEELRALTWSDVDLKNKLVYVLRSDREGGDTKTEKSRRGLAMADQWLIWRSKRSPHCARSRRPRSSRPKRPGKGAISCSARKTALPTRAMMSCDGSARSPRLLALAKSGLRASCGTRSYRS